MVVLDVDHPDIAEFVETKAREEHKIRVLRDAGFDMDLGGDDIISVQYQNANNSVRVSDEFMRAVDADTDEGASFGLRARQTGEVIETVDARELFGKITQAAWECADPGIQYDDTINDWHTTPESGRITASNPCSEYMHLDNSSCNLASLNLMKFLSEDGTFDAPTFARAVEFVITAMDISICFADFPTQPIAETTRAYRQLGIGYANLGALLMATGHAYDSEGGRSLAAAITSLMTGVRPSWPASSDRTRATPATPTRTSGSSASTPRPTTTSAPSAATTVRCSSWPPPSGRTRWPSVSATATATRRPACSPRPAPSV
jgi:ribonucleoside-diphosphate reductase alpha chain